MSKASWKMIERGRRWQYIDGNGKILGAVVFVFDEWDAILITGKKFPDSQISVNTRDRDKRFWAAKRAVEESVAQRISSPATSVTQELDADAVARKD